MLNASNNAETKLSTDITAAATSLTVEDASTFPAPPFLCSIDDEIIKVTAVDGNTFTGLERGQEGTAAAEHVAGTSVENRFTAGMYHDITRNITQNSSNLETHKAEKVHQEEIHGLRVNKATGEFEYFDGEEWKEISVDALQIRDNPELNLRFKVSDTAPAAVDGRVYYNTEDKLFYVARNGQWWRLYVGGDEKLEQNPPDQPPQLESRTDTTIKLVADTDMEYMYQGGDWQESSLFTGLSRNTEYTFYSRYKETEIYKASPPGPSAKYSTDKGTQSAPAAPNVTNIEWDRATVIGASGTEVRLGSGTWYNSPHTFTGLTEETTYLAYARYKETNTHYASPISPAKEFTTPTAIDPNSWQGIQKIVRQGLASEYFSVGDQLVSEYDGGEIIWEVIGIDVDTPADSNFTHSMTLQTKDCLHNIQFDAPEPNNPDSDRQQSGNNRYIHSAVRQWLNSNKSKFQWKSQHQYDAKPTDSLDLYNGAGFLYRLDPELVSVLGAVNKKVAKADADGGGQDSFTDKVFLLSRVEVGLGEEGDTTGETVYPYYDGISDAGRIKTLDGSSRAWWLRSPRFGNSNYARTVGNAGNVDYFSAYTAFGLSPACCII